MVWTVLPLVLVALVYFCIVENTGSARRGNYTFRKIARTLRIPLQPFSLNDSDRAEANANAESWKRKFVIEFPALNITKHQVPDEENGFRLLYELGKGSLPISDEFAQILSEVSECDLEVAKRCLSEHSDVVAKVERIGSLQTRSSTDMPEDYIGFISARAGKQSAEILLLKARLAAVAQDEKEALRYFSAAINLADHYCEVEAPSLLSATVSILIDLSSQTIAFKSLLPALGKSADLEQWKALLCRREYTTAQFAHWIRGEWQNGADFMAFPLLAQSEKQGDIPDAEAVCRRYSSWINQVITKLPSLGLAEFETALPPLTATPRLSKEGHDILEVMIQGLDRWGKGYVRAAVVRAQGRAAMDLLILERSGTEIMADDVRRITVDPVSSQPYAFDPTKREIAVPSHSASMEILPLALPW